MNKGIIKTIVILILITVVLLIVFLLFKLGESMMHFINWLLNSAVNFANGSISIENMLLYMMVSSIIIIICIKVIRWMNQRNKI